MNSTLVSKTRNNNNNSDLKIWFLILLFLGIVFLVIKNNFSGFNNAKFPELKTLNASDMSFADLSKFFKDLAVKKGAKYAFNVLNLANLPPNTDFHLLGHGIGDILYKQQGLNGIKICTQDFRNSCSHSIVVGLFVERGVEALDEIAKVCRDAPGGAGAYAMCFHGLGHGILAFTDYDMGEAVDLCKKTGTVEFGNVEIAECVGGVTMEMVSGVHDAKAWELQKDNYLKPNDALYPCNQPMIPAVAKPNCFMYITPHMWEVAGGNLSDPKDEDFKKAFTYCENLTGANEVYKSSCYGSFGKEFVGLSMSRDIRKVGQINDKQLKMVYDWCLLASNQKGILSCINMAANSLYWGGENKPFATINFCKIMSDAYLQGKCYEHVVGGFKFYNARTPSKLYGLCRLMPEEYKNKCLDTNYFEPVE